MQFLWLLSLFTGLLHPYPLPVPHQMFRGAIPELPSVLNARTRSLECLQIAPYMG